MSNGDNGLVDNGPYLVVWLHYLPLLWRIFWTIIQIYKIKSCNKIYRLFR